MIHRNHRADIDGLRAIAVVLVVLFHATARCPGGFIGVDVFFVISGFLITGLLLAETDRGGVRLLDFWLRRVRRLLPAAAVMVLATLAAGFVLLPPWHYRELAKSAIAQQLLLGNVFFARRAGYFDASAELQPLLHTWSLAVEEQFYLAYPILLLVIARLPRPLPAAVLGGVAAASFAASDAGAARHGQWAFYLLPPRAWEILLGGLLCFLPPPRTRGRWVAEPLAALGLAGILIPAWAYDRATPFPGRAALLPCAATAVVIYATSLRKTLVGRLLQTRPLVFTGLISYSLYLWHWPLLSFLHHLSCGAPPPRAATLVALAASVILAVVSWKYVEQPFRRRGLLPRTRDACLGAALTAGGVMAAALVIVFTDGLPARLGPQALAFARAADHSNRHQQTVSPEAVRAGTLPAYGAVDAPRACLLWGDSHAMALIPGMDAAGKAAGVRCICVTTRATAPLLDFVAVNRWGLNERGPEWARSTVDHAKAAHIDVVFMAARWEAYAKHPAFEASLAATVRELAAAGIRVVIVRNVAEFPCSVPLKLFQAARRGADVTRIGVPLADHARRSARSDAAIHRLAGDRVTVLDLSPAFVDAAGLWRAEYDGVAMYSDTDHLSLAGSLRAAPLLEAALARVAGGP